MPNPVTVHSRPTSRRARPRTLLSLAIAAALGAAAPLPALAQTGGAPQPAAQPSDQRQFNIQGGPLDAVLNRFALEAGIDLSVSTDLTRGKTNPGLQGPYSVEQALRTLLAGSGLSYRFASKNRVTLVATQAGGGPMLLDPIQVTGWSTSVTEGYRPTRLTSATKTDSFITDIPMTVSVVSADVIEDQNATSVAEALKNTASVEASANFANVSVQEEFTVRGFENSFVNVNGMERRSTGPLSVANIESIEVVKGLRHCWPDRWRLEALSISRPNVHRLKRVTK